jgi:cation diffusion facilitator family transporter
MPTTSTAHGKVESFSALIETLLLLLTCSWIVYEAIQRLAFKTVEIDANAWAFAVMGVSIIIDISRSRALYRIARRHGSQALEADALHFSTDVWSSAAVIAGLILVRLGELVGQRALFSRADALAALGVAAVVIVASYRLGRRTVDVLVDRAPSGLPGKIEAVVKGVEGVHACRRLRVRRAGPGGLRGYDPRARAEPPFREGPCDQRGPWRSEFRRSSPMLT